MTVPALGVYVHVPFCATKCDFCHFSSGVYSQKLIDPYFQAVRQEIRNCAEILHSLNVHPIKGPLCVDSVYIGGGTPTLVPPQHLGEIMRVLRETFELAPETETTLEANPGTLDADKISWYRDMGVNRISMGVQSFQDDLLRAIGRSHSVADAVETYSLLRSEGFSNISLDLIAGLPGQTAVHWEQNLDAVCHLRPDHLSLYLLEIHERTRFGKRYREDGSNGLPAEEEVEEFYLRAVQNLASAGYHHYEISNFSRPGRESQHNLKYWTDQPYLGFGCSAHSYLSKRWSNQAQPSRYVEEIRQNGQAVESCLELSVAQRVEETLFLGLRLSRGVNLRSFRSRFGFDLRDRLSGVIGSLQHGALIQLEDDWLRLTTKGFLVSNEVLTELMTSLT
ncbi:MAG: radical SAM family heme chaperone HemW [Acidobacteriota bacterium]